ncbi:MAG: hypothetical protein ABF413_08840, partial [Liquorilactobacillus mali]
MQKLPFVYVLVGSRKLLYRKEVFLAKALLTPTSKTCGLFNELIQKKDNPEVNPRDWTTISGGFTMT